MKKYFLRNALSSSVTGFCLTVLTDIKNNSSPFIFIFMSLQNYVVFLELIHFLSCEFYSNFSVIILAPISTTFPVLLHPFCNRIQSCMKHSGCDHATALGRGAKVLSVLVSVPFLRIHNVLLISLSTAEPWSGAVIGLLTSFSKIPVTGLEMVAVLWGCYFLWSFLIYWQLSFICQLKRDESDSLSCLKVIIPDLVSYWGVFLINPCSPPNGRVSQLLVGPGAFLCCPG